ncbi:MAG: hypothetical protein J6023_05770 [Clostridia bacterium]|nr:hypothetical protein [Clostridia bacterium]
MSVFKGGWRPHDRRALAMAVLFGVVCVVYVGILLNLTVISRGNFVPITASDGSVTYEIPVHAQRGGIYDRNGVPIVTNENQYNLVFYYDQFMHDSYKGNETLLATFQAMNDYDLNSKRVKDYFPIEGVYPDVHFTEESQDRETTAYARLNKYLTLMDLSKDSTAKEIVSFVMRRFSISTEKYSSEEVMQLVRVRYDMEATQFSSIQPYTLAQDIGSEAKAKISEQGVYGLWIESSAVRLYHYPGYASHILGRIGAIYAEEWPEYRAKGYAMSDQVGISGCELAFEDLLHAQDGVMQIKEDKDGNRLSETITKAPVAGSDIYLTIDISLQIEAENALAGNINAIHNWTGTDECDAGSCVVMKPDTFEILAMASYPTFNLATFNEDYDQLLRAAASPFTNRATIGLYAPGSTFKVGMTVAAIMEQQTTHITKNTTIDCTGKYTRFSDYQPTCWVYTSTTSPIHEHGELTAAQALEVSCNIFFYEAGYRLGIEKMNEYCKAFGLGEKTGIELSEQAGTLAGPGCYTASGDKVVIWNPGDTLSAAIGQSYNEFTPLQLAAYISTVVNGGTRYQAHLFSSAKAFHSDDPVEIYDEEPISKIDISEEALSAVKQGMKAVTESSSTVSYLMSGVPVKVGSKTGTAQKTGFADYAMYVCAAPYDDPEIVISVCMEKGSSGGYSAYTASRILEKYYAERQVPEDGTTNPYASPAGYVAPDHGGAVG